MSLFKKRDNDKRGMEPSARSGTRSEAHRAPLKLGSIVEHYFVEGVIGGGGYSIVYRCYDTDASQSIVLKEYFPNQLSKRSQTDEIEPLSQSKIKAFQVGMHQFFAEAHALSKITHPNVVNIINVFRANSTAYMVSRFEAGKDLRWFIKRCQGILDQPFLQKVIPPIISGINALHKNQMLHLDIKPANIFLRTDAGPLLLDFGATKLMDKKERFSSFQTLTPGFAPPEQHNGWQLSASSDIYALGATIYACITGYPPPTSPKREEKQQVLRLRGAEKRITQSVIDAIYWALEMDISKRPQTLNDFADLFLKDSEWSSFAEYEEEMLKQTQE